MSFAQMFVRILRPKECHKHWYTMQSLATTNNKREGCDCLITCKYPPPSSKQMVYIKIPRK
jgi:hypothetical protein